jgi:DNA-binding MarR family transcriptional regulator
VTAPATATPLARLFAVAYRTLIDDLHTELRRRGWTDVRPAYGFALLAARDQLTSGQLASLMGMTKQAASKLVDAMVSADYLERRVEGHDARRKRLCLTTRGENLLAEVELIYAELERQWAEVIGTDRLEGLRADLQSVLTGSGSLPLSAIRPPW